MVRHISAFKQKKYEFVNMLFLRTANVIAAKT